PVPLPPLVPLHATLTPHTCTLSLHDALPILTSTEVDVARAAAPDVVFVCSPNNPTGNAQPVEVVRAIAEMLPAALVIVDEAYGEDRKSTRLNSSHVEISYAVFCLKKKTKPKA